MSSLWDSRFTEASGRATAFYTSRRGEEAVDVGDILAATKSQLPYIGPEQLQFHGVLGAGSSFRVNREVYTKPVASPLLSSPYFVAVKYMLLPSKSARYDDDNRRRKLYASVGREIRALMHTALRDHCCVIPVLAYGWTNHPTEGANPYLVVDYTDHGTLTRYLRRCTIPLHERRELALDVAVGIKVLHENNIIHGDIKPENILVFDSADDYSERPQTAKIGDFGSSLFQQEVEDDRLSYLGTSIYNAPEIEGRGGRHLLANKTRLEQYKKADVYSFGLLLWETANKGEDFLKKLWLEGGELELGFLDRICKLERNGLRQRAYMFCDKLKSEGAKLSLVDPIQETLGLALLDNASERADIEGIIESLSKGSRETRGATRYPLAQISPPTMNKSIPPSAEHLQRAMPLPKHVPKARYTTFKYKYQPTTREKRNEVALIVKEDQIHSNRDFVYGELDMFHISIAESPPWNVQSEIVDKLKLDIAFERDAVKHAGASLQFSICHRLGFGIEPNLVEMIRHLANATKSNTIAQSIFSRVWLANEHAISSAPDDIPVPTALDSHLNDAQPEAYFMQRIRTYQQRRGADMGSASARSATPLVFTATTGDAATLERLLDSSDLHQDVLSEALLAACRCGQFPAAMSLLSKCRKYHGSTTQPTPLHWLIMFNESEVSQLARILVSGESISSSESKRVCDDLLNTMPKSTVNFPEHCLELLGSPLHWAVRVRHLPLIRILIELGADVNLRWKAPRFLSSEPAMGRVPNYSPLDLAVVFHIPDAVDILLRAGASVVSTCDDSYRCSPLHLLGRPILPFTYDILHGKHRREAVRQVIQSLKNAGCGINARDSERKKPLARALENPDLEVYVLEELLDAGALVDDSITRHKENAAIIIGRTSVYRRLTTSKLSIVLPLIPDINKKDNGGGYGRNALHHCTAARSGKMTEILLRDKRISVDERTSNGQTALHISATYGAVDVLDLLVREGGASLNAEDELGQTPLQIATTHRWTDAVHALIRHGSEVIFTGKHRKSKSTVLHTATSNEKDGSSIVAELLDYHAMLRQDKALLDAQDCLGWTALHQAAYYGDKDGVETLVKFGANQTILSFEDDDWGGCTALELANGMLGRISAGNLGADHERIEDGGPVAVSRFAACLTRIRDILMDGL